MLPTSGQPLSPHAALQHAWRDAPRPGASPAARPRLLIAGATGVIGNDVLRALVGGGSFLHTEVLACEPTATGMAAVRMRLVSNAPVSAWPVSPDAFDTAIVMFEPPRLYHGRERSLFTPQPADLPALAHWLRHCGVRTLAVVVPHETGRLPDALKRGLANLDEQAVAALGFERLLLVRSARKAAVAPATNIFEKTAAWMLATLGYMIPASEQPVRPVKLAAFIEAALRMLPAGTHVASPELLAQANHSRPQRYGLLFPKSSESGHITSEATANDMQAVVRRWLESAHNSPLHPSPPASSARSVPPR